MNFPLKPLAIAIIAVHLSACSEDPQSTQSSLEKSRDFVAANDLASARVELTAAALENPADSQLRFALAKVRMAEGQFAAAEKELIKAQQLGTPAAQVQPLLAITLFKQYNYQGLIDLEKAGLATDLTHEDHATIFALIGRSYAVLGNMRAAEIRTEHALELGPESEYALTSAAMLELHKRSAETALEPAQKALSLHPDSANAWATAGDVYRILGRNEEALDAYTRSIDLTPYTNLIHTDRAQLLIDQENYPEATKDVDLLLQSEFKTFWLVQYLRGRLEFASGDYQAAAESFGRVLNQVTSHPATFFYAALTHSQLGNFEQAQTLASQAMELSPRNSFPAVLYADILLLSGEEDRATDLLKELLEQQPSNTTALELLGKSYMNSGYYDEAVSTLTQLIKVAPESSSAQQALALAQIQSGEDIEILSQPLADRQSEYSRQFLLAYKELRSGDTTTAREMANSLQLAHPEKLDPAKLVALSYVRDKNWEAAESAFLELREQAPTELRSHRNLIAVYTASGNTAAALAALEAMTQQFTENPDTVLYAYRQLSALGERDKAKEFLAESAANYPENSSIQSALVYQNFLLQDYERVIELSSNLKDGQASSNPRLQEVLGLSHHQLNDETGALRHFTLLVELLPNYIRGQLLYAESLHRTGDVPGASAAYDKVGQLAPNQYDLTLRRIKFLIATQQLAEARALLAPAQKLKPDDPLLLNQAGILDFFDNELETAAQKLERAMVLQPAAGTAIWLSRVKTHQRDFDAAHKALDQWLDSEPADLNVNMEKAGVYLSQQLEKEALGQYSLVIANHPDFVPALNNYAWLSRESDPDRAMKSAQRAFELEPKNPAILDTLGFLHLQVGESQQARKYAEEASALAPDDYGKLFFFAQTLHAEGDDKESRLKLREVIKKSPDPSLVEQAQSLLSSMQ